MLGTLAGLQFADLSLKFLLLLAEGRALQLHLLRRRAAPRLQGWARAGGREAVAATHGHMFKSDQLQGMLA